MVAFLIFAVVTQTLKNADLVNIREVANAMGPLRKPLFMVINFIEKLMNFAKKRIVLFEMLSARIFAIWKVRLLCYFYQ